MLISTPLAASAMVPSSILISTAAGDGEPGCRGDGIPEDIFASSCPVAKFHLVPVPAKDLSCDPKVVLFCQERMPAEDRKPSKSSSLVLNAGEGIVMLSRPLSFTVSSAGVKPSHISSSLMQRAAKHDRYSPSSLLACIVESASFLLYGGGDVGREPAADIAGVTVFDARISCVLPPMGLLVLRT